MLLGIGLFLAIWGVIPFLHKPAEPALLEAHAVVVTPAVPECMVQEEVITVFIHGSVHVPLAFLSPFSVMYDSFNGSSWYEKTVRSMRHHMTTQQGGVLLSNGLCEVTHLIQAESFDGPPRYNGACHVIRAFQRGCNVRADAIHRFFTFGWSGILSERERRTASEDLYDALYALKQEAVLKGRKIRIELYGFSHGGQIALHLPVIRKMRGDSSHFTIDRVILLAVPLWHHNTRNILMGMFSTVVNCYSPGDFAQTIDRFSTPEMPCQTIAETMPLPDKKTSIHIVDLAITLGDRYAVPHCAFFHIDKLSILPYRVRRSRSYKSRYEAVHKFIELLHPLPLIVLYPYLLAPLEAYLATIDQTYHHATLMLSGTSDSFHGAYCFSGNSEDQTFALSWPIPTSLAASQQELKTALAEQGLHNQVSMLWHQTIHALSAFWKN